MTISQKSSNKINKIDNSNWPVNAPSLHETLNALAESYAIKLLKTPVIMTKKNNNNEDNVNDHKSLKVPEETKVVDTPETDVATVATDGEEIKVKSKTGGFKKRTVTIKSDAMPKTVKGLKTRKEIIKEKIKKAEKKLN